MPLLRIDDDSDGFADSTAATALSFAAVIVIDDSWLEAVLDNLALAKVSREEGINLLRRLDDLELLLKSKATSTKAQYPIIVGDHFEDSINAYEMRAPESMTAHNILETIERAATYFVAEGHAVAMRQLTFFITGNLQDVLDEEDLHEE